MALPVTLITPIVGAASGSVTTASFTPTAGTSLIAVVTGGATSSVSMTASVSDSISATNWTTLSQATNAQASVIGMVTTVTQRSVSVPGTVMTVSASVSGGTPNQINLAVYQVSAANIMIGATGQGTGTGQTITPTLFTSKYTGSTVFVSAAEWSGSQTLSSSDLTFVTYGNANSEGGAGYKVLGAPGAQTASLTVTGTTNVWLWSAVELFDADVTSTITATATISATPSASVNAVITATTNVACTVVNTTASPTSIITATAVNFADVTNIVSATNAVSAHNIISFVGFSGNGGATATEPVGVIQGDILLASANSASSSVAAPAGWTQLGTTLTANGQTAGIWWLKRGASAPSYTWTNMTGASFGITVTAFRGGIGIDVVATGTAASATCPSVTPNTAFDMLVCIFDDATATGMTAPAGMTLANGYVGAVAYQLLSSQSATGTKTFGSTSLPIGGWTVGILPANISPALTNNVTPTTTVTANVSSAANLNATATATTTISGTTAAPISITATATSTITAHNQVSFIAATSSAGATGTEPTGTANGDVVVATVISTNVAIAGPAGWTQIGTSLTGGGYTGWTGWIKRGASAPSYVWTNVAGANSGSTIATFRNTPGPDTTATGTAASAVAPTITPKASFDLLVCFDDDAVATTITAPSGMTLAGGFGDFGAIAYLQLTTTSATGTKTFGSTSSPVGAWSITLPATIVPATANSTVTATNSITAVALIGAVTSTITDTSTVTANVTSFANLTATGTATTFAAAYSTALGTGSVVSATSTIAAHVIATINSTISTTTAITAVANINPVTLRTEMLINGKWIDISTSVLYRSGISLNRGRRDESSVADVSNCAFDLRDPTGTFNPKNPNSPYYGYLNMSNAGRVWVKDDVSRLVVPQDGYGSYGPHKFAVNSNFTVGGMQCNSTNALSITGDIDMQFDGAVDDWTPTTYAQHFIGKNTYQLYVASAFIKFAWSSDGVNYSIVASTTKLYAPYYGRKAVRATMQVNVGGHYNINFYYAKSFTDATNNGWTQLGTTVIGPSTTSILATSDPLTIGGRFMGKVYAIKVYSGISGSGGTLVASPDFTTKNESTST